MSHGSAPKTQIEPSAEAAACSYSPHAIHLLRTAQLSNLALSQMADQKASILMGATFVVFSLIVSRSFAGDLPVSLFVLAVFAFASSICAVAAVIPSVSPPQPREHNLNRLFFGHYALLDEPEWTDSVLQDLQADEALYRMMLHDIHQHGRMLQRRKYRFLGYAYRLFVIGLTLTLIVFGAETVF